MLTALAITATSFAAMVIPASAAVTPIDGASFNFENDVAFVASGSHTTQYGTKVATVEGDAVNTSKVLQSVLNNQTGGRNETLKFPNDFKIDGGTDVINVAYDWYTTCAGGNNEQGTILVDNDGKKIFDLTTATDVANVKLNSEEISTLPKGKWYHISADLDFETKTVLKLTAAEFATKETPVATVLNVPFAEEATGVAGFYLDARRNAKNGLYTDVRLDNITAGKANDDYFKSTITVTDKNSAAVADATVVIDETTYTTDAQGQVVVKLTKEGTHTYTISKIGYNATGEEGGDETVTGNITSEAADVDAHLSLVPYTPEVTKAEVSGGQKVIYAPTGDTAATSTAYTVAVTDQNEQPMETGYTTAWVVNEKDTQTAVNGVTAPDGVVTVTKDFTAGAGKDALECDVVATVTDSTTATKTATAKGSIIIANSDILHYATENYTADIQGELAHDIEDIEIPATGITMKFNWNKGAYDNSKDDRYNMISFKNDDTTIFDMKDMNAGLTLNAGDSSLSLGTTERNTPYPTVITIIGKLLIISFNSGENQVIELAEAPTKITSLVSGSNQTAGGGGGVLGLVMTSTLAVDPNEVVIVGDDKFAKIAGKTVTRQYTAKPYVPEATDNFVWSIDGNAPDGVSIDAATGILSVTDAFTPTNAAGDTIKIKAVSGAKNGEFEVTLCGVQTYTPEVEYPKAVQKGEEGKLTVTKIVDALGDDVTEYLNTTWKIDDVDVDVDTKSAVNFTDLPVGAATAIYATYDGTKLADVTTEQVTVPDGGTLALSAVGGTKVMLWNKLDGDDGIKPLAPAKTVANVDIGNNLAIVGSTSGKLLTNETAAAGKVTVKLMLGAETIGTYEINVADYSEIVPPAATISVADLVSYGATTYNVVFSDGTAATKTAAENNITLTTEEIAKGDEVEVIPVYKFDLGGASTDGYTKVEGVKANGYGFTTAATPADGTGKGIQSKGVNLHSNSFEVDIPDGRYDMTFYKADTNRTHIRVNEYMTATEADFTDGDNGTADPMDGPGVYTKLDVNVTGGVAKINAYDWDKGVPLMAAVEITKKSEFQPRKTHIWIAGDSTVCNYRPTVPKKDSAAGTRRTGWGQLLEYYLGDSVIVDNFAHSGDWADNWYKNTFPSVIQNAEAGDYLIIQFGINDRTRTPDHAVVQAALSNMVDECRAKGVIPVLQTPELCPSQYGTQVTTEHTKPTGSGHGAYFEDTRTVAKNKNTLFIDLADVTGDLWAKMGKSWVTPNYFLNNTTANVTDTQHMAYIGAKLVAGIVAAQISDQKAANKTGAAGETFAGIPVNAVSDSTITYTDYDLNDDGKQDDKAENQTVTVKLPAYELDAE